MDEKIIQRNETKQSESLKKKSKCKNAAEKMRRNSKTKENESNLQTLKGKEKKIPECL